MTITLDDETQKLLEQQMREGGFKSAGEVVRAALESLSREQIPPMDEETQQAIDRGMDEYERGETLDGDHAIAELRKKYLGNG